MYNLLGIFVLSGQAAANNAGPAVTISFIVAAIASGKFDFCACASRRDMTLHIF